MRKHGTHWKPRAKQALDQREPLRPIKTRETILADLRTEKAAVEEKLKVLFQLRRSAGVDMSPRIQQASVALRQIKAELARLTKAAA